MIPGYFSNLICVQGTNQPALLTAPQSPLDSPTFMLSSCSFFFRNTALLFSLSILHIQRVTFNFSDLSRQMQSFKNLSLRLLQFSLPDMFLTLTCIMLLKNTCFICVQIVSSLGAGMRSFQLYSLKFLEFTMYSMLLVLALIILLKKLGNLGSVIFFSAIHSGNPLAPFKL